MVNGALRTIKFSGGQYPPPGEPDLTTAEMIRAIESHRWYGSLFFAMGEEPSGVANLSKSEHQAAMNAAREAWKRHLQEVADAAVAPPMRDEDERTIQEMPTAHDISKMNKTETEAFLVKAGVDFDEEEHLQALKGRVRKFVKES